MMNPQTGLQIFLILVAMMSVPVLLLGKPFYLYWLYRGGKGLRRRRVRRSESHPLPPPPPGSERMLQNCNSTLFFQGYERVRRVSEDDGSAAASYEDEEEEEGLDEVDSRESLPKQVRDSQGLSILNNSVWKYGPRINYYLFSGPPLVINYRKTS